MERSDLHPGITVTLKPAEELNRINYVMPEMMKYADQSFEIEKIDVYSITLKGTGTWAWGVDAFVDENNAILPEISEDDLMELIGNG